MDAKIFGAFIAECRKEKNMTQADLAIKLNVTDKAVSRWERGIGFPDINTIEPLASALGIGVLELMKSERIMASEVSREESADIITDTLNIAKLQRKHEQKIAMMRVLLTLFAGTNILYAIGKGDYILQIICIVCILVIAVIMSVIMVKNKENNQAKQTIIQMLYCGLTVWFAFGLSQFVGNIIASILIITITVCYVRFLK